MSPKRWCGDETGPAWEWPDRWLVTAWRKARADVCPVCGQPRYVHNANPAADDYSILLDTCPSSERIERAMPGIRKRYRFDELIKSGLNPGAWFAIFTRPHN